MRLHFLAAAATLALLGACGQQAQQAEAPPAVVDQPVTVAQAAMTEAQFVQFAVNTDAFEMQASELAEQRGERADVKQVAETLARENTATSQEIAGLAPQLGLTAPQASLDVEHQQRLDTLRTLEGEAFDDAYLDQQVEAHENAVRTFQDYAQNGAAGPLRDWASATLPKLQQNLASVQSLENAT